MTGEEATIEFARQLSVFIRSGDVITLEGELGTGKTTFARAFIRALVPVGDEIDVPSPTFTIVQHYDLTRVPVAHFDFYRVKGPEEAVELGFPDLREECALIIEWPQRVEEYLPSDRLEIEIADGKDETTREVTLSACGDWADRLRRMDDISTFLTRHGYGGYDRVFLQGDASTRRYERLIPPQEDAALLIFMDSPPAPDGSPVRDGLPYSRIAHIAENVSAFAAVCRQLRQIGLATPEIFAADRDAGYLVIEDLGGEVYQDLVRAGDADMTAPYELALEVLSEIADAALPSQVELDEGGFHIVPPYDRAALEIEVELLLDWYWPEVQGSPASSSEREKFLSIWRSLWPRLEVETPVWCLRDYHSPNLIWRSDREGLDRVGILDFQDAVRGHPAYDVASLLQDARVDVSPETERVMLKHYFQLRERSDASFDRKDFAACYAILAAQRATRILGIFMRLNRRDGKPGYLQHVPRLWRYLERTLEAEVLKDLREWYETAFPQPTRRLKPQDLS